MDLPAASEHAICRTIGLSLPEALVRLAGEQHRGRTEEFRAHFRWRSDQVMVDWTELYPHVPDAVRALRNRGLRLGIVSTKYRHRIESVLCRENLRDVFDVIVGGEDVTAFKPDPEGLRLALEKLRVDCERTAYVGDSITDADTARRAGLPFIAVLSGVTEACEFEAFEPRWIVRDVGALADLIQATQLP
jgi:phosphoglycolate phosphatase